MPRTLKALKEILAVRLMQDHIIITSASGCRRSALLNVFAEDFMSSFEYTADGQARLHRTRILHIAPHEGEDPRALTQRLHQFVKGKSKGPDGHMPLLVVADDLHLMRQVGHVTLCTAADAGVESKFRGKNYVFDGRLAERITDDVLTQCVQCGTPCDDFAQCANVRCHTRFIQVTDGPEQ